MPLLLTVSMNLELLEPPFVRTAYAICRALADKLDTVHSYSVCRKKRRARGSAAEAVPHRRDPKIVCRLPANGIE
jgi:hypothetical protein